MIESNTTKALKGISSQALVTIILGVLEVISFSIMSRLLTQEDFGYYAVITSITVVFASFSETGIGAAIIQRKDISKKFIDNSFTLSLIFGSILTISLILSSYPLSILFADSSIVLPLILMSFTLLCNCLTSVNTSIMHRRLEFFRVGLINLISLIVTTIVAILLAIHEYGYYAIIVKGVLTSLLTLFLSYCAAKTRYKLNIDKDIIKSIWSYSGWLMASVFFRNLAQQMDRLLMARLVSFGALGMYNRPKEFINQISSKLGNTFDIALFPVLSQLQDDMQSTRNAYKRSIYYLNIASVVLTVFFIFNGNLIIRIFFGEQWFDVLPLLNILSLSIVFGFNTRLADCYLRSLALTKQQFYFRILDVFLKILGLFLGSIWGIIGIASSVLITEIMMVFIKSVYLCNQISLPLKEYMLTFISSMRIIIIFGPLFAVARVLLPDTLVGDILMFSICCVIFIIVFAIFPTLVGSRYKNEVYPQISRKLLKYKDRGC